MNSDHMLRKLAAHNPVRYAGQKGLEMTRRRVLASMGAAGALALTGAGSRAMAQDDRTLNLLCWDAYADPRLAEMWLKDTGTKLKSEIHISDPQSLNRLRAGETKNWDFINVNDPWAKNYFWPEKLIVELPRDRFEPLYDKMLPKFKPPYARAMSRDGEHLLGVVQRLETFDIAINTDKISVETAENEGWDMFNNADFKFGVLAYEDWNVMDLCMIAGVHPYKDKSDADVAKFTETANRVMKQAKTVTTDFVQLNLAMLNNEIDAYFCGGTYSIASARREGNNNLWAISPPKGPADGKGGINWIELNSAINNPNFNPKAFDFLEWMVKPDQCYIVASGNGNLQPVAQMIQPEVLAKFSKEELDAMQYDTLDHRLAAATEFDIVPQYDKLYDIYTAAVRARG
ncbi:MAG: extracellular solute-binding protein [Rhizobiales bacterium]|nr:extracellular solute-binding protein [Hyphomicrobiales bacterium]